MAPATTGTPRTPRGHDKPTGEHGRGDTAALVLGTLSALLLALVAASWQPLLSLDSSLARSAHRQAVRHEGLTHTCRVLSDWVWDPWTFRLLAALLVVWLFVRGARDLAVRIAVVCVAGTLLQQLVKAAVGRERPVWPDPVDSAHFAAFPSGHALTATVVSGLLWWVLRLYGAPRPLLWAVGAVLVASVVGVGLTRVWLGVHWPSDVVGGWLLGALLVVLGTRVRRERGAS
ncbi:phosphatase PAP2 family protein [Streptomyces sp. NPDC088674]|uniref:phosphatase PAP2 family protein n=1 Tax=Streptomyces sp. NPDC088674 TaxID=3365869 RepID=UPI0038306CF6